VNDINGIKPPVISGQPDHYRFPRAFAALASVPYRWLLAGNLTFFLAMQGLILVRSLLAWELTGSEMSLAYINLMVAVPMVFGSLIGGAITDRVERKGLVIIGQLLILLCETVVLVLIFTDSLAFWHMMVTAFCVGCVFPFVMPARMAIVYNVVGRPHLANAIALIAGANNLARVLGPALIGLMIHFFSITGAYVLCTLLYLISTVCMLKLPACQPGDREVKPLLADMIYGFKYVTGHRPILICLLFGMFPMLIVMPIQNLMVVFTDQVWGVGDTGLGLVMTIMGIGGVIGALWVARMPHNVGRIKLMVYTALAFAVFLAGFSLTPWFYLALIPLLIANIFANASQTLNNTVLQLLVDDNVRGRMSSFIMLTFGLTPLGVLPVAYLSEKIGAPHAIFWACMLLGLVVIAFYVFSDTLRNLDERMQHQSESTATTE
jgi:MFS family permease